MPHHGTLKMKLKYFKISDFDSPDLKGSGSKMKESTLSMLDEAREICGIPFIVNSGFRTKQHNANIGGSKNSSHMKGYAVDIRIRNSNERFFMIKAALKAGFHRIGIYDTFIHLDNDPNKIPRMWKR